MKALLALLLAASPAMAALPDGLEAVAPALGRLSQAASRVRPAAVEKLPDAASLPKQCGTSEVHAVQAPVQPGRPGSKLFTLRYAYRPAEDPNAPVVIFIPGGPGQGSIGAMLSVPYQLGIVRTDPRGAACNENPGLAGSDLNSENIAADVLAVIRDLQPKRYILYGASYGTMVATIVAAKAREAGAAEPSAVVLEGVIGRAYRPEESLAGFIRGWKELKGRLPRAAVEQLSSSPPPLGFSPAQWGGWIQQLLLYGESPGGGSFAVDQLSALDPAEPESGRELLAKIMRNSLVPSAASRVRVYHDIACSEIDAGVRGQQTDMELRGGELVPIDSGFCRGTPLSRPFDAGAYPVSAPVFYFSGAKDPATPEFQARYHFDSQPGARKAWIRVPSGGHLAFSANLMDCYEAVWMDIAERGGADLESLVRQCSIRPAPTVSR